MGWAGCCSGAHYARCILVTQKPLVSSYRALFILEMRWGLNMRIKQKLFLISVLLYAIGNL